MKYGRKEYAERRKDAAESGKIGSGPLLEESEYWRYKELCKEGETISEAAQCIQDEHMKNS